MVRLFAPVRPSERLLQAPVRTQVLTLALPAVGEMMLVMFAQIADMIMVGRLGPAAVAAVSVSAQPVFLALGLFQALGVGTTALVARFVGAQDRLSAQRAAGQSLTATLAAGLVVGATAWFVAPFVVVFMGAGQDVVPLAVPYFRTMSWGIPTAATFIVMSTVSRGAGDPVTPMRIALCSNLVNVLGNYALIFGHFGLPAMGVTGAGIATAFSRLVSAGLIVTALLTGRSAIGVRWRPFDPDFSLLPRVLRVGYPAALEQLVMRGGQLCFVRIVAGLGTLTLAAHQIALNIESLAFMPSFGFATATTALVGQNLGASNPGGARAVVSEAKKIGAVTMVAVGVGIAAGGSHIMRLYTTDPEVIAMGTRALRIMAIVQPAMALNLITAGGLRGAGDTRWVLASTMIGIWGVRLGAGYILAVTAGLGLTGAWMGMALDQCVRSGLLARRVSGGRWLGIDV